MLGPTRRQLLKVGGTSAIVGIAGCSSNTDENSDNEDTTTTSNNTENADEGESETNEEVSLSITSDFPQELQIENSTTESYEVIPIVIEVGSSDRFLNVFNLEPEESRAIYVENPSDAPIENPRILQPPIGREVEYYDDGGVSGGLLLNTGNNIIPSENSDFTSTKGIQATATNSTGRFAISSEQYNISDPVELKDYQTPPVSGASSSMEFDEDGNIILDTEYVYWINSWNFEVLSATDSEEITASIPHPDVSIEFVDATVDENELTDLTISATANNEYYVPEARIIGVFNKFVQENQYTYFPELSSIWSHHSGRPPYPQAQQDTPKYTRFEDSGETYVGFIDELVPYDTNTEEDNFDQQLIPGSPEERVGTTKEYTFNSGVVASSYFVFDLPIDEDMMLDLFLQSGPTILDKTSVNVAEEFF